jgi:hypothetical protein
MTMTKIRLRIARSTLAILLSIAAILPCPAQTGDATGAGDGLCVSNLLAEETEDGGVRLSWSLPEEAERGKLLFFAIYRDLRPIYSGTRVKSLYPIAAVPKNHVAYLDEAGSGKNYYYAVLSFVDKSGVVGNYKNLYYDEELDGPEAEAVPDEDSGMLYSVILPGINTTIAPARAYVPTYTAALPDAAREASPPSSAATVRIVDTPHEADRPHEADSPGGLGTVTEEAETKYKEGSITPRAEEAAYPLLSRKGRRRAVPLTRHIFSEDQTEPQGGDDYLLYRILQESWLKYRYTDARATLTSFLAQRREAAATGRATFYLAEAEYFMGNYAEALNLFLTVQDSFPQLSGKWIDSCIDLYSGN